MRSGRNRNSREADSGAFSPESSSGVTAGGLISRRMRAIYLSARAGTPPVAGVQQGNYGVGPFLCCLANLMDLFALLLLAEIAFAAHRLDLQAATFLDASGLLLDAVEIPTLLPARLGLVAGGRLYRRGSVLRIRVGSTPGRRCAPTNTRANKPAKGMTKIALLRCIDIPR